MLHRLPTAAMLVVCLALGGAGCSTASPEGPTSTSSGSPTGPVSWTGSPDEKSATWATDLDPRSQYGLHKAKGLDPIVKPEVKVLTSADVATLTSLTITNKADCLSDATSHPACLFELTFTALPAGVTVGSVLNSGVTAPTPTGMLVKVTSIDGTTVKAVQASLTDALVQGEFWQEQTLSADHLRAAPTLAPGVTVTARAAKATPHPTTGGASSGHASFDPLSLPGELTIDGEPVDGVHVSGSLDFGAGCGLDGGVGGSDIAWVEVSCHAWEEASLTVRSTGAGARHTERYFLADFPLAMIPIPIGPIVVVVVVDILVTADFDGLVHVDMHYGGSEHAEVRGALKFSIGHGLDHDGGVKVGAWSSAGGLKADVSATALARAEVRLSAYGVLGFYVGGDASLLFSGGPGQNPRWQLRGNAGVAAGIFLGLLGFQLQAYIAYHLKNPFAIASGGNSPPELSIVWPSDGEVIAAGGLLPRKVEATAQDTEDGALPVTWTDQADGATVTGKGPQQLPFKALGTHVLEASVVDSEGATAKRSVTVTVKAPTLTMALTVLSSEAKPYSGQPQVPAGSVVLVDASMTTGALTPPACSSITWSATNAKVTTDGSCRARVTLPTKGAATVTTTVTDAFGTKASAQAPITVVAAPATVTPQFLGIDASANGRHLVSGDSLLGADPVKLTMTYVNPSQAKVTPAYSWTYTSGSTATALPGAGAETVTSTRTFTPPTQWGLTATFTVTVTDAATTQLLTTRTFTVKWQSMPR
jgi:hypothetical protein